MKFYSELGDDRFVFENFFRYRSRPGTYLEAYATDGLTNSKTKAFQEIGWKGILVEPMPHLYEKLTQNRPKDDCVQAVLSDAPGHVTIAGNTDSVRVRTDTLENIIKASGRKYLDVLFLNLQGTSTEYKVISGLGSIPVGVLCLKSSNHPSPQSAIHNLLEKKGYKLHQKYHDREIWTGNDLENFGEKKAELKTCPKTNMVRILVALHLIHMISNIKPAKSAKR